MYFLIKLLIKTTKITISEYILLKWYDYLIATIIVLAYFYPIYAGLFVYIGLLSIIGLIVIGVCIYKMIKYRIFSVYGVFILALLFQIFSYAILLIVQNGMYHTYIEYISIGIHAYISTSFIHNINRMQS